MSSSRRDTTYPVEGNQNFTRVQNCAKFYTSLRSTNQYTNQWKYPGSTAYTAGYTITHTTSGYISSNVTSAATGDYTLVTSTSNSSIAATTSTALTLPNDALIQSVIMEAASGTITASGGGTINVAIGPTLNGTTTTTLTANLTDTQINNIAIIDPVLVTAGQPVPKTTTTGTNYVSINSGTAPMTAGTLKVTIIYYTRT
jgi:hypothetical protein